MSTKRIAVVFGTRPDAIKMAPIILHAAKIKGIEVIPISSGQHREMLTPVLALFGIQPAYDAAVFEPGQSLDSLTGKIIERLGAFYDECKPDVVLVHGDTTTGFAASLAAFYRMIPIGHVEAGLRTASLTNPFPEEMNRRLIDKIAAYHFAPTESAQMNLVKEGITTSIITGNTVVDALSFVRAKQLPLPKHLEDITTSQQVILLTTHRRENIGDGMVHIFQAVRTIIENHPNASVIFPIHLNAAVRTIAQKELAHCPRVHIIEPLDYTEMVALLERVTLIMTDSGGLQEEAPSFGKPVLILRETTERPEVVAAGCAKLVGTDSEAIVKEAKKILDSPKNHLIAQNPYGQPGVSTRILEYIKNV